MNETVTLLGRLRELDIRISLNGDRLAISGPKGALTGELKTELASRKSEIIGLLRDSAKAADSSPIRRVDRRQPLPMSAAQRRLWFIHNYTTEKFAYNVTFGLRFTGALQIGALERAFDAVIRQHEVLRTAFADIEGTPTANASESCAWKLDFEPLDHLSTADQKSALRDLINRQSQQPFDLSCAPLMRAQLIRLGPAEHVLAITIHHIIADGWSFGIFAQDLLKFYEDFAAGRDVGPTESPVEFADYVQWREDWLTSGRLEQELEWWKPRLAGPLPVIELPADHARPAMMSMRGARLQVELPADLTASLQNFANQEGVTLFILLTAAFKCLLMRYTGQTDVVVGSAHAGRNRPEIEHAMGLFINTVVLRTDLDGNPTVRELLGRVRETTLNTFAHADVPFDQLVTAVKLERELNRPPLVQVMLTLHNFPTPSVRLEDLVVTTEKVEAHASRLDLTIEASVDKEGCLCLDFEYSSDLFEPATIRRMQTHLVSLLEAMLANPSQPIAQLAMQTEEERALIVQRGRGPEMAYPATSLHETLLDSCATHGDRAAVRSGDRRLTFREVVARSRAVAGALMAAGVRKGDLVAVCLDRSVDMPVALLGVLQTGAAYVPLDPHYPQERLAYMMEDSQPAALLTESALTGVTGVNNVPFVLIDQIDAASAPAVSAFPQVSGDDLAYVIYTSGSTGRPKGVEIRHRAVVNFLYSMRERPGLTAADRLLAVTTLCFDIAGLEMYLPLLAGAELVIAPRALTVDGVGLAELLQSAGITTMQATPATWQMLFDSGWKGCAGLKALCGGEAMPRELANRLLESGCELWNLYGPTETTIWSTVDCLQPGEGPVSIGAPIANTTIYILDQSGEPVSTSVIGELCIGGDGLARGYRNQPELTVQKFFQPQWLPGEMIYRTGDLARWRPDGSLEFLGRLDSQVKIRGFRIELGEIETVIRKLAGVQQAAVVVREHGANKRLDAYLTAKPGSSIQIEEIRRELGAVLPDYMVPSTFTVLPKFPLTLNGKVDRKALPEPQVSSAASHVAPRNESERQVASIWSELLHHDHVGISDNFFDLGGHSLMVVQLQSRLNRQFGGEISLLELFQRPTVSAMAQYFEQRRQESR